MIVVVLLVVLVIVLVVVLVVVVIVVGRRTTLPDTSTLTGEECSAPTRPGLGRLQVSKRSKIL